MIENTKGYEKLPESRRQFIAEIKEVVKINNLKENQLIPDAVFFFSSELQKEYPEINFQQIPEYQAMVGGGEGPNVQNDPDVEREIISKIQSFIDDLASQKAAL